MSTYRNIIKHSPAETRAHIILNSYGIVSPIKRDIIKMDPREMKIIIDLAEHIDESKYEVVYKIDQKTLWPQAQWQQYFKSMQDKNLIIP